MRKLVFLLFIIISISVHAEKLIRLAADSEPLLTVANCVNITDGSFFHVSQDFSIDGPIPLTFTRHYDGGFHDEVLYKYNHHGYAVSLGYPLQIKDQVTHQGKKRTYVDQREHFGVRFDLTHTPNYKKGCFHHKMFKSGYTNCTEALGRGIPSLVHTVLYGWTEPTDKKMDWEVIDLDHTKRFYTYYQYDSDIVGKNTRYLLQRTEHPNGLSTHYLYDQQGQLEKVCVRNTVDQEELTSLSISYDQPYTYSVLGSDGRNVVYHQTPKQGRFTHDDKLWTNYLFRMTGHDVPNVNYTYTTPKKKSIPIMNSISGDNGRFLNVEYTDMGLVRSLMAPLDDTGLPKKMYLFRYKHEGHKVEVIDALGRVDCYYLSKKKRLERKNEAGLRIHQYGWDKSGQLLWKMLRDVRDPLKVVGAVSYKYTDKGNISEKWEYGLITGDDLSDRFFLQDNRILGPSARKYLYEYGECNTLIKQQDPNGLVTQYCYKPGTNLLVAKLEGPATIEKREFYTYDKNAILIEKIEDDGSGYDREDLADVTYRRITRITPQMDRSLFGLTKPAVEELSYLDLTTGEEVLLKRIETDYVQGGHVGEKRTYDSAGILAYQEICHYNIYSILDGICDRRGCWTNFGYDGNLNVNHIDCQGMGKQIYKKYDYSNRLIEEKEVHEDGTVLITAHTYDLMGNRTSTTDPYGFKTLFFYDPLNRKVKEIDPYGAEMTVEYDVQDNPIVKTDKEGHTTHTKYNIDHHPLQISYPDGSVEEFFYYLDGTLRSKKEKDGSFIEFTYNAFGKVLTECRLDQEKNLLTKKSNFYKGENLIAEIDPEGFVTTYTYDGAGRCTSKTRGGIAETYGYDTLGRRHTVQRCNKITRQIFDVLDRVVEERIENLSGQIYRRTQQVYDNHGNVTKKRVFTDENHSIETTTLYNSCNLPILKIDGLGNETTFHYNHAPFQKITVDPLGGQTIESYDAFKRVISKEMPGILKQEAVYSPNGHRIKQIDHIYQQGVEKGLSSVAWEYDSMGNVVSLLEKDLKETRYTYLHGRLDTCKKPDGIILYHSYDPLGKLIEQSSSDGTLSTHYAYDLNGNMLSVVDIVNGSSVERTYDAQNNITSETTHTTIYYSYDELNRVTAIYLPDSSISYTYNPADLVSIKRQHKTHTYSYDLAGRLLQEDTFDGTTTFYSYDDNNKLTAIISPHYIQSLEYDAVGNIIRTTINDKTTHYTYDPLRQLTSENTTSYTYDSLYNRLSRNNHAYQYNILQQVVSDDVNIYTYDPNGNRLTKNGITYTYDVLNRLTSAGEIIYTYDPLGRLQSRTSPSSQEHYLYYKENDLGTTNNLKILGRGIAGLEQNGNLYSVIRDHQGSPTIILSDAIPVAAYSYSAFGETTHTGTIESPWQYTSHRCDSETKLLHAPKRVYDPYLGQWLTPDPLGFADGPNLYAYVHNNPLIYIDPTGLFKVGVFRYLFNIFKNISFTLFETTWGSGEESSNYRLHFSLYKSPEKGGMSIANGIRTRYKDAVSHSSYAGEVNGGYNVDLTHTASHGILGDIFGYISNRLGFSSASDQLLHKQWDSFFATADKDTPYLQICHSRGAVQVRNALMSYSQELRQRIIVVAIAPGAYIDRSLCMKVTHYVTRGDLVTWLDLVGRYRCREDVVVLESQTRTGFMDHSFQSKTYEKPMTFEFLNYNKMVAR